MKIIENGSGRVVAQERWTSYITGFFIGLFILAIGLYVMFFSGRAWKSFGTLSHDLVIYLFSGAFILIGLFVLYTNERTTIIAEKITGRTILKNTRLFIIESSRAISTLGLESVVLQEVENRSSKGHRYYTYELLFMYGGDKTEPIFGTENESVFNLFGLLGKSCKEELAELGKTLAGLFDVKYEEKNAPRIGLNINLNGGPLLSIGGPKEKT